MSSDYLIIEGVVQDDWGVSFTKKNNNKKQKTNCTFLKKDAPSSWSKKLYFLVRRNVVMQTIFSEGVI
jgi:hypothetical protein